MIRPFTLIALLAAGGAGLNLYSVKREAQLEDQKTVKLLHEAKDVRAHAGLLHAEYDLLSDPDRLHELANQVLKLQPTDPKQYVALADLTKRLPPIAPLPTPPEPPKVEAPKVEAPKPELVADKAVEKAAEKLVEKSVEKPAEKPEPKPMQVANIAKPASVATTMPTQPALQIAAAAPMAPHSVPAAKPATPSPTPSVQAAAPAQLRPPAPRPMPAVAEPPSPAPMPYAGSALGMARMRAKFVPSDTGADR
jgi:hypothetical protein